MNAREGKQEEFELNAILNWEPMQRSLYGCHVLSVMDIRDDAGTAIL